LWEYFVQSENIDILTDYKLEWSLEYLNEKQNYTVKLFPKSKNRERKRTK
jgi:hypothetical protein